MSAVEFDRSWSGSLSDGLLPAIEKEMSRLGQTEGERLIVKQIDQMGLNFEGDMRKSVTTLTDRSRSKVTLEVGPDVEHAEYVFFGTRPHWAPIAPLKDWARRKLGDEDLGYAVQHKIAREGTRAHDFLTDPGRQLVKKVPDAIERVVSNHLEGE